MSGCFFLKHGVHVNIPMCSWHRPDAAERRE